jgi:hypothetical protein
MMRKLLLAFPSATKVQILVVPMSMLTMVRGSVTARS